ncbi:hypothetical protein T06_11632 [Trichinella sp. T6]|nr:hypothetical protein T06_11632 [Trichinella sp. T6]
MYFFPSEYFLMYTVLSRCGFSVLHLWYISNFAGLNPVLLFGITLLVPACQFEAGRYGAIVIYMTRLTLAPFLQDAQNQAFH